MQCTRAMHKERFLWQFRSYNVQQEKALYQVPGFTFLYVIIYKHVTTIEAAKRKGVKRDVRGELMYYSVEYACYHGGKNFKSRSSGTRPQHR